MDDLEEELRVEDKISPEGMGRFLKTGLSREDNQGVVRRMLAGTLQYPSKQQDPEGPEAFDYDDAFRRTERSLAAASDRILRERQLAATQWAALEGHPPTRRLVMARNDSRLHHWGLFDRLLAQSRETAASDATAAAGLAE